MRRFPWTGIHNYKSWALSTLVGGLLFSTSSFATITLISAEGASNTDFSVAATPKLFAGFAGSCTSTDNTKTCDSCTGADVSGSKLWPCNKRNAYPTMRLTIRIQSNSTTVIVTDAVFKVNDNTFTPSITPTMADGILTAQIEWRELCGAMATDNTNCTKSFSGDFALGFKTTTDSTTTNDLLTFKVYGRAITAGDDLVYQDCPTTDSQVIPGSGYCHFSVYRGDSKIYADQLGRADGYPATTAAGIEYTGPVFFFREQLQGEDDNTTIANITNASDTMQLISPEQDNRIDGLENEVRYCMVMANQDQTGIISFFTPLPGTTGGVNATDLCATPSQVVGLLDDKHCFIATAAFGSDMAPEVQSFRDFRNKYLLNNSVGTRFVKFYYKHSPFYAEWISHNEFAKTAVRVALWPLLFFARLSVTFGLWTTLLILTLAGVSAYEMYRRWFRVRKVRGVL